MNERNRLEQLMEAEQMNAKQFAQEVGIQAGTISNIMSGRNNPSLDVLQRVLNRFRTVSTDWMILGVGSMYRSNGGQAPEQTLFDVTPHTQSTQHTQSSTYAPSNSHTQSEPSFQKFSTIEQTENQAVVSVQSPKQPQQPQQQVQQLQPQQQPQQTTVPVPTPRNISRIIIHYSDSTYEER